MFEGNTSYLYVANNARGTDTVEGMANGSAGIVDEQGTILTALTSSGPVRVVQKLTSGQLVFSPEFELSTKKNTIGRSYEAATDQLTYLGFNGVSGSFDATADETFVLHVEWSNSRFVANNTAEIFSAPYTTSAASQYELVNGLVHALDGVIERQPYEFINFNKINNAAVDSASTFDTDTNVVNGVDTFLQNVGLDYDSTTAVLAIGDYIRFGASPGVASVITDAIYKVTAINGLYVTVDRKITAPTGSYSAATFGNEVIAAGDIGADWGIKFEGQTNSDFDAINDAFSTVRFDLLTNDFTTAEVTKDTEANEGYGSGQKLANLEVYAQFQDKMPVTSKRPRNIYRDEIVHTTGYDVMSLDVSELVVTSPTTGMSTYNSFKIQIATLVALGGDDLDTVLGVSV